jgi:hypothetical protein
MLDIAVKKNSLLHKMLSDRDAPYSIQTKSLEEKVRLLIIRDLTRIGWETDFCGNRVTVTPPKIYNKQIIRDSMQIKRQEILYENKAWIKNHRKIANSNLADGSVVWNSNIEPMIEVCQTQEQLDIFRFFRYYWSSPFSEYVGRRVKLLIRDNALPNKPLIGIAALGSSIVHIPDRDNWIGWNKETRTKNLIYAMDAYVLGALPPYNLLLGGKLISYVIASNEVRKIYKSKYRGVTTNISKRKASNLACIFTTSLYGHSSQYNRIKYENQLLYIPIGHTKGYGTLHLTNETFNAMKELVEYRGINVLNRFGDGPIWRMRVIRTAADILGFNANFLLQHSFKRDIYAIPLAYNFKDYLMGNCKILREFDCPLNKLVSYWKERWLSPRKLRADIKKSTFDFSVEKFEIT